MNTLIHSSQDLLRLAYPGITAECILWKKEIYEIVWNCGGFSAQLHTLTDVKTHDTMLPYIEQQLESIRKTNSQIIFLTDSMIYENNQNTIDGIFENIFWKDGFVIIGIENESQINNNISGVRMNYTKFRSNDDILNALEQMPNAIVVSSIPRSDPRITHLKEHIIDKNLENSFAYKSLRLLELNAHKLNQLDIAKDLMWHLGTAHNADELLKIFETNPDEMLVVKGVQGMAGGADVNFIANQEQRQIVLQNTIFPILVFRFLSPTKVQNTDGSIFATQYRPHILSDGTFLWWTLKIPSKPLPEKMSLKWASKNAFSQQNKMFNSSSGVSHSFFLDQNGMPVSGYVFDGKMQLLSAQEAHDFLSNFYLAETKKSLLWDAMIQAVEPCIQNIASFQRKTNQILGIL